MPLLEVIDLNSQILRTYFQAIALEIILCQIASNKSLSTIRVDIREVCYYKIRGAHN